MSECREAVNNFGFDLVPTTRMLHLRTRSHGRFLRAPRLTLNKPRIPDMRLQNCGSLECLRCSSQPIIVFSPHRAGIERQHPLAVALRVSSYCMAHTQTREPPPLSEHARVYTLADSIYTPAI